jgi:hypothetical protein
MTQRELAKVSKKAIEDAIYSTSKQIGRFPEAIWIFSKTVSLPDGERNMGVLIEIPRDGSLGIAVSFARVQIEQSNAAFTILASDSPIVDSVDEAQALIDQQKQKGGIPETIGERHGYTFYAQAPGLKPVVWGQRFHYDENRFVVLDGKLKRLKGENTLVALEPIDDIWIPATEEDRERVKAQNMPMFNPSVLEKDLTVSKLFPKDKG